jgi:hypothetical protein
MKSIFKLTLFFSLALNVLSLNIFSQIKDEDIKGIMTDNFYIEEEALNAYLEIVNTIKGLQGLLSKDAKTAIINKLIELCVSEKTTEEKIKKFVNEKSYDFSLIKGSNLDEILKLPFKEAKKKIIEFYKDNVSSCEIIELRDPERSNPKKTTIAKIEKYIKKEYKKIGDCYRNMLLAEIVLNDDIMKSDWPNQAKEKIDTFMKQQGQKKNKTPRTPVPSKPVVKVEKRKLSEEEKKQIEESKKELRKKFIDFYNNNIADLYTDALIKTLKKEKFKNINSEHNLIQQLIDKEGFDPSSLKLNSKTNCLKSEGEYIPNNINFPGRIFFRKVKENFLAGQISGYLQTDSTCGHFSFIVACLFTISKNINVFLEALHSSKILDVANAFQKILVEYRTIMKDTELHNDGWLSNGEAIFFLNALNKTNNCESVYMQNPHNKNDRKYRKYCTVIDIQSDTNYKNLIGFIKNAKCVERQKNNPIDRLKQKKSNPEVFIVFMKGHIIPMMIANVTDKNGNKFLASLVTEHAWNKGGGEVHDTVKSYKTFFTDFVYKGFA